MNSSGVWELRIRSGVRKTLARLPADRAREVALVIESLAADPYTGDLKKIKGEQEMWRRRVGSYRIFYELIAEHRLISVFRVERRTSKTY